MKVAIPADDSVKIKEREKIDKYLYLGRGLKNLWDMKVLVIPVVVGALGMVLKVWKKPVRTGDQRKIWDYPDHSTIKNHLLKLVQITKKKRIK